MTEVYMDRSSAELLVLTILALIGTCAAVADNSVVFTVIFAISAGVGGFEIMRRAVEWR
jgi:hypothetical protein